MGLLRRNSLFRGWEVRRLGHFFRGVRSLKVGLASRRRGTDTQTHIILKMVHNSCFPRFGSVLGVLGQGRRMLGGSPGDQASFVT